jgi:hypothetical protein
MGRRGEEKRREEQRMLLRTSLQHDSKKACNGFLK